MGWFTRKKEIGRAPILASEIPVERYGPAPPPPRTPYAPGASRHAFGEAVEVAASGRRAGRTAVLSLGAGEVHRAPSGAAFVVLSGAAEADGVAGLGPGDSLVAPHGLAIRSALGAVLLVDVASAGEPSGSAIRFGRHDLAGRGFAGITGIRAVHRTGGAAIVRLGPPPGPAGSSWGFAPSRSSGGSCRSSAGTSRSTCGKASC